MHDKGIQSILILDFELGVLALFFEEKELINIIS